MNYKDYINEAVTVPKLMYHGRRRDNTEFDIKYVGKEQSTDQEGPGFYFSTDKQEAEGYRYGGNRKGVLITAKPKFRKVISNKNKPKRNEIKKLVKMIPNIDDELSPLSDWGYGDGVTTLQMAIDNYVNSTMQYSSDELDAFLQVWIDMYRYEPQAFVKNLVKMGYDASIKDRHIIVYNPKSFDIVEVEK